VNEVLDHLTAVVERFDSFRNSEETAMLMERKRGTNEAELLHSLAHIDECIEETREFVQGAVTMYDENVNFVKACKNPMPATQNSSFDENENNINKLQFRSEEEGNAILAKNDKAISSWSEKNNQAEEKLASLEKELHQLQYDKSGAEAICFGVSEEAATVVKQEYKANIAMIAWSKQINSTLCKFSGVAIGAFEGNTFVVNTNEISFRLKFGNKNYKLVDVQITGGEVKKYGLNDEVDMIKLIKDEGVRRNDPSFVLRELRCFSQGYIALMKELSDLKSKYPLTRVNNEIVVTLPEGIVVTLFVDNDYPRSSPRLLTLDGFNGWKQRDMERVKARCADEIEKETLKTIKDTLSFVSGAISL